MLSICNFSIMVYNKIKCYFNVKAPFIRLIQFDNSSIYASTTGGEVGRARFEKNGRRI